MAFSIIVSIVSRLQLPVIVDVSVYVQTKKKRKKTVHYWSSGVSLIRVAADASDGCGSSALRNSLFVLGGLLFTPRLLKTSEMFTECFSHPTIWLNIVRINGSPVHTVERFL